MLELKLKNKKYFAIIIYFLITNLCFAEETLVITSDKLYIDNKLNTFKYSNNVKLKDKALTIKTRQLTGKYGKNKELEKVIATGDVKINKENRIFTESTKAEYISNNETLVLTGEPVVKQDGTILKANKILFNVKTEKSEAFGDISVDLEFSENKNNLFN